MTHEIYAPASPDGTEGLLATVHYRGSGRPRGTVFPSDPGDPLQVGLLTHPAGTTVAPHRHPPQRRVTERTAEVLVVLSGLVTLTVYGSDGVTAGTAELGAGDIAVLHAGGHGLRYDTDAEIIEVKQGPYVGPAADKVLLGGRA